MTRILLHAKKDPFDVISPDATLHRNVIRGNTGNLLFIEAAYRLLATRDTEIELDHFRLERGDADRINDRYDAYVLPLADIFRPSAERHIIRLTGLIERLRIPVVVLGVGARMSLNGRTDTLAPIERSARNFVKAVLDRSSSIGVRGEFSQSYVRGLGFRDVDVIGCPSMFLSGERLSVKKKTPTLERDARVAIMASPGVEVMGDVLMSHHGRYSNLTYVGQELADLALLLWRATRRGASPSEKIPTHPSHPLFRENKFRFFVDPWPWIAYLRDFDFVFGTRIHGTIAGLLAGTPAYVLAHDSRTLELARYFAIPHRPTDLLRPDTDAAELFEEADYAELNGGHPARLARILAYIERNGLRHVYQPGEDPTLFDARVAATIYPPAVDALASARADEGTTLQQRLRYKVRQSNRLDWVARLRAALTRGAP